MAFPRCPGIRISGHFSAFSDQVMEIFPCPFLASLSLSLMKNDSDSGDEGGMSNDPRHDRSELRSEVRHTAARLRQRNSRIGEAENRVSQLEDENAVLTANTAELKSKVALLEGRIQYQENYSRRNNLRIKGVPERSEKGNNALECVMDVLRTLQDQDTDQIVVERAHRIPATLKADGQNTSAGPRHILVRFLRFADREKVRLRAREVRSFQWRGNKIEFFPDFMKEVQEKRNKFFEVRRMCRAKGLKYTTQYPAVFWVFLGKERLRFEDATAAKKIIDKYQPPEEGE
uniref:L1 transposable element RRM domain-containing protein n=1 Tax=Poecilia reticulata TaxID=8081 RepID=A0A3P9P9P0_POERE